MHGKLIISGSVFRKISLIIWVFLLLPLSAALAFVFWEISQVATLQARIEVLRNDKSSPDEICISRANFPSLSLITKKLIEQKNLDWLAQICESKSSQNRLADRLLSLQPAPIEETADIAKAQVLTANLREMQRLTLEQSELVNSTESARTPLLQSLGAIIGVQFETKGCAAEKTTGLPKANESNEIVLSRVAALKSEERIHYSDLVAQIGGLLAVCQRQETSLNAADETVSKAEKDLGSFEQNFMQQQLDRIEQDIGNYFAK